MEQKKHHEAALWTERLSVLRTAISLGKPGAVEDVKREIEEMGEKMAALVNRRELIPQTLEASLDRMRAAAEEQRRQRVEHQTAFITSGAEARARMIDKQLQEFEQQIADLAELIADLRRPAREVDEGATPESFVRPSRRDPLDELENADEVNGITHKQALAGRRIRKVCHAIARAGQIRIGRLDGTPGGGKEAGEMADELADEYKACYLPWASRLSQHAPDTLAIVTQVSVFWISLHACRVKAKIGRKAALAKLRDGLDQYADLYDLYAKSVNDT